MKIVITGTNGFIGANLLNELKDGNEIFSARMNEPISQDIKYDMILQTEYNKNNDYLKTFAFGSLSGLSAWIFIYPSDLIKTSSFIRPDGKRVTLLLNVGNLNYIKLTNKQQTYFVTLPAESVSTIVGKINLKNQLLKPFLTPKKLVR